MNSLKSFDKWFITITVMLAAMIEIIDTTIVNVVLHDMAGALGASTEEITWVITSYIVAAAIFMPLTGFLVNILGRKKLLILNITGFMIASMLCGFSTSLTEMVIFRLLQGVFGASLVPLSQYILRDTFSLEEQPKAMAIWGVGIMAAPVLGPTIGGYIADYMNWRWIFYINVPVCLIALVMTLTFISETETKRAKVDWIGLMILVVAVGALQIFLDRGNTDDWLSSNFIFVLMVTWILGWCVFIYRGITNSKNILNLNAFKDRNFAICNLLLVLYTGALFGILTLQAVVMESIMGYTPELAGLVMAPRGIASAISMILCVPLSKKVDMRILLGIGIVLSAWGSYDFALLPINADFYSLMMPGVVQGFGMGLFFVPLSTLALQRLPDHMIAEGSGIFSFARNLGTSIGVSVMTTVLTQTSQAGWNTMIGHIRDDNPNYHTWLQSFNWHATDPLEITVAAQTITQQSTMIGFINSCYLGMIFLIVSIPFVFLLQRSISTKISTSH
ncbi:DHA2 family efflux MFS transporter permease subunit [Thiotrichales bacterium 19S3-7]|nr:DHA2 family efflux MFS transporter permease subunit [Thiotrichales bacterium 19S3-7]MCF6802517.1 DHA2 family efflux MFS transporter permease subunit [Thiotrichales bacterium 19S3-11]